ncbi:hypothetical protein DFR29_104200 [Tahibacter aquaticus]|uniref:HEAT repeat protein n=1 Tax=Tahibacter aquaticus TaxID=520092 RepID=A0A4R6Z2G5_9GAMM|nr:hypothetical protein [Tahibacter aquaticus]TDR45772.1 hypothetical protein DFR29_104200 [Tahibacter aquaticus]
MPVTRLFPLSALAALLLAALPVCAGTTDYRDSQRARLAQANDRDSLVAAVLLALPADIDAPIGAEVDAPLQRLRQAHPDDTLALYLAAAVCQMQPACSDTAAAQRLVERAPENALHWVLLPHKAAPDAQRLHQAAQASQAQPHLGELVQILRRALGEDAATASARAAALDAIPVPRLSPLLDACKGAQTAQRDDCIAIGRLLLRDEQGAILSRMIGSVLLRRLLPGTPEADQAKEFRRQYVWLSEHVAEKDPAVRVTLQRDIVALGEWEAWQRAAERAGAARTPPQGWTPANPQTLLLSEERSK